MASWVKCAGVDLPGHESSLGLCAFNLAGLFWLSGLVSEGGPHLQAPPSSLRDAPKQDLDVDLPFAQAFLTECPWGICPVGRA